MGNKDCLKSFERTLLNLQFNLNKIFSFIYTLFPKNSQFRKDLQKTKELSKNDFIKQF